MILNGNILRNVKPYPPRVLPEKYDLPHAVAFYYHDELASLIAELESSYSLLSYFEIEEDEKDEILELQGEKLWNWLNKTGRKEVIRDLTYRQLTAAVIADATHFICESLLTSGKGKLTVSFSLLSKPFKENLLLLEWMCADPDDLLNKFNGISIESYVLNRLSKSKRLKLMKETLSKIDTGLDEDFLWRIRYAKEYGSNLETLWTKATHLVTSVKASATEPGNLNFVFSDFAAREEQWDFYYNVVPLLLYYFLEVADFVASRFVEWDESTRSAQILLRRLAFFRYSEYNSTAGEIIEDIYTEFSEINFICLKCESKFSLSKHEIDGLWLKSQYVCPNCKNVNNFWELFNQSDRDITNT